jgi:hypothetical protein
MTPRTWSHSDKVVNAMFTNPVVINLNDQCTLITSQSHIAIYYISYFLKSDLTSCHFMNIYITYYPERLNFFGHIKRHWCRRNYI